MDTLLKTMFIKRFCLPSNIDITLYENGKCNISSRVCGNYNHVCVVLKNSRVLSFGINTLGDKEGRIPGIHAEHDTINKLVSLKNKKNLESINLLVIRISSKNKIQSSKPCSRCIEIMKTLTIKKGYKIKLIYYSDENGDIIKSTLTKLDLEEKHISKFYRQ